MKRNILAALFCFFFIGLSLQVSAQSETTPVDIEVQESYAQFLGKTPPLRNLVPRPNMDPEKRKLAKSKKKAPNNFAGRGKFVSKNPDALPQGEDPTWQKGFNKSQSFEVEPLVNVEGIYSNFGAPHDPSGDIGQDHYVQAINSTNIAVFDKEGNLLETFTGNTLWSSLGFSSAGDPIILYDQEENRWIITEFPSGNQLLVAISETSDPMGSWNAYNFGTPNFPDYPKYSVWGNSYVVTTNEEGPGSLPCYFIDRQAMLDGAANVPIQRITLPGISGGPGFFAATPVDWTGLTPPLNGDRPMVMHLNDDAWSSSDQDRIDLYTFAIDWNNANNTNAELTSIFTSPYDSNPCSVSGPGFSCVPQGGNGGGLDGLPEIIMNQTHYRNFGSHESMVLNFVTDVTGGDNLSGIRWVELRRSGGTWDVYQEGTFAPDDGLDRYMGAICMDGNGNIGLAYNVSSENEFVGVRYTGRRASDPLGQMTVDEYNAVSGTNTINSGARFGDYSHMSIDPTNDRTFWYTTEYAGGGNVRTRIVAFELGRDTIDIGPSAILSPMDADDLENNETVSIEVTNFGIETQNTFDVGYIVNNGNAIIESVNYTLELDSTYIHTFTPMVDMSTVGDYEFKVFTSLVDDESLLNDTLRRTISKLPRWDAGISDITGLEEAECVSTIPISIVLTNFGTEVLTSVTVTVELNGGVLEVINWTGNLASGASENINLDLNNLNNGINDIVVTTSSPNNTNDEIPVNDSFSRTFNAITNGVDVMFSLNTDFYPEETTWEITEEGSNAAVLEGGPYDSQFGIYNEEWCLNPAACYTFTIFDAYSDGICCDFGEGSYTISTVDGEVLATGGDFAASESSDFCPAGEGCVLLVDIDIASETTTGANDGVIILTPMNGAGDYEYSIDGGATFQSNGMFSELSSGTYDVVVQGAEDCYYEGTATITSCALDALIDVSKESSEGANNGEISIAPSNGSGPYQFSIDGGNTFQGSNNFTGLATGSYDVVIEDNNGCSFEETVNVGSCTLNVDSQVFNESSEGEGDGSMVLSAENGAAPYQYSINGGGTFQDSGSFTGLSAGAYNVVVQAEDGCQYEATITIAACALSAIVNGTNASSPDATDGSIEIIASGGIPSFQFSIDGGVTFQNENVFTGLPLGDYNVVVQDAAGCVIEGIVESITDIERLVYGQSIEVSPNPTDDGIFRINIKGLDASTLFLNLEIYNSQGQRIQTTNLVKYDDTYTGMLSLVNYPAGIYYVRFLNDDVRRMVKVIRN